MKEYMRKLYIKRFITLLFLVISLSFLTIDGACQSKHQSSLSWGASSTSGVTYNVKRSSISGGPYAIIAAGLTTTNYTDSNLQANTLYCYVVSATLTIPASQGNPAVTLESPNTAEACGTTNKDITVPGSITLTIN